MEGIQKFRHNVMDITTMAGFANVKGGFHGGCKDVYFVRALGTGPGYLDEVRKMEEALAKRADSGQGYYRRLCGLPKLQGQEDISFYTESYAGWAAGGKQRAATHATQGNAVLEKMLGNACAALESIEAQGNVHSTDSMRKNSLVKMLFWFDAVFCHGIGQGGPAWEKGLVWKIVAANITKRQEYLFFYLLTRMGCDVLLLQAREDIGEPEEKLGLSAKFVLGEYAEVAFPAYDREPFGRKSIPQAAQGQGMDGTEAGRGKQEREQGGGVRVKIPEHAPRKRHAGQAGAPGAVCAVAPGGRPALPAISAQGSRESNSCRTFGPLPGEAEKSFEELARLASSVVMIAIHDHKGDVLGTGSGIMVGRQGYILTNNHVASGGKYYSVRIEEEDKAYTTDEIIKYNYVLDLAVLRINRSLSPIPVYQGQRKLVRGQKVVAIGSPLGLFNSVSDGIISGFRKIDNVDMIQFTAPTSHGSSGGAVLNMQGEVIGISTAGFDAGQNINLAVGYECINLFIKGFT